MAVYREQPTLPSPIWQSSISAWLRKNLFSSWLNGLVTVASDRVGFHLRRLVWQ